MGLGSILLRSSNYSFAALSDVVVSSLSVPCVMKLFEKFPRVGASIVEPVIGWIKEALGFRRFHVRGVAKARGEWNLVCLAVNLKRLHRIGIA